MKRFWQWLATALLVAIFLSLANWQWNRASELKNPPKIDPTIVPLDSLIAPSQSMTEAAVARKVSVSGTFVSNWILPNQADRKSWVVGLFQTKDNAMILVVRGHAANTELQKNESNREVKVIGYLVPQQSRDAAENVGNQISRVDSALFVTRTELPLYAPYIHAISEEPSVGFIPIPFEIGKKVPGYYWQHISYVVIWFLFAVTAIFLMIYQRKSDRV
jgi:cytochrome oxidase assembly protein ShyY1